MKKILFVANVAKEHINKFHIPTIKEFKNRGWIVDVACAGEDEVPFCDTQFRGVWKRSPFTLGTLKGIKQLKNIIANGDYDVVYCHTPVGGLIARLASIKARKNGTKVIYCAHGFHFFKGAPLINWLIYYPIEKMLSYFTDLIFTINSEDYETAKTKFNPKAKIELLPGIGVNFDRLNIDCKQELRKSYRNNLNIPENATVLIYIAELIKNKNQKMLINTLKELRNRNIDAYLLLVGPDHNNGLYQQMAKDIGVDKYTRFLGWRSDVGELMYTSDICVASSIREGFGINIVEAMYCGLPVVATNNRGHATIVNDGQNGFLVNINDSVKMSEKIITIIENNDIYNKLSNLDISKYDCDTIAIELVNIITTV